MTLQYIKPVTIDDSSPAVTATMTSSRSASPGSTCPCCSRARPCSCRAQAIRSASRQRSPISTAVAAVAYAASQVAGGKVLLDERQQEVAPLGAVRLLAFQQPLGAGKPSGRAAHLAAKEKTQPQPESATDGAKAFAGVQMGVMGTFERSQIVVVPTDQIRRHRQQLEILGLPAELPRRRARATDRHRPRPAARNTHGPS